MKRQGQVVRWDAARAFGFIRSAATSADIFFHIRDFHGSAGAPPRIGLDVVFEQIEVGGKGPRAVAVRPAGASPRPTSAHAPRANASRHARGPAPASGALIALPLMLAYGSTLVWAVFWVQRLPWWVLSVSAALNLLTFFAYWQDKYAAGTGRWRTPESSLHLWSLAGGWGGAWFAQQVLRHKSAKAEFRSVYWFTTLLHCAAVGAYLFWDRL